MAGPQRRGVRAPPGAGVAAPGRPRPAHGRAVVGPGRTHPRRRGGRPRRARGLALDQGRPARRGRRRGLRRRGLPRPAGSGTGPGRHRAGPGPPALPRPRPGRALRGRGQRRRRAHLCRPGVRRRRGPPAVRPGQCGRPRRSACPRLRRVHPRTTVRCHDGRMSTGSLTTPDVDEQDTQAAEARDAAAEEPTSEAAEVSSFTSTVPTRRTPARAPNGRFVGAGGPDYEDELPADRYLERELSWLQFNERVLQLAMDPAVPLLERTRFLAIFANNLDEYFMVRVAGLKRRIATGLAVRTAAGLEPRELIERIARLAHELMQQHASVFQHDVRPSLEDEGISLVRWDDLDEDDREPLHYFFADRVFPLLTPLAVEPAPLHPRRGGCRRRGRAQALRPARGRHRQPSGPALTRDARAGALLLPRH